MENHSLLSLVALKVFVAMHTKINVAIELSQAFIIITSVEE